MEKGCSILTHQQTRSLGEQRDTQPQGQSQNTLDLYGRAAAEQSGAAHTPGGWCTPALKEPRVVSSVGMANGSSCANLVDGCSPHKLG